MANLTYNIYTGTLVVQGGGQTLIAFCQSGGSNLWSDSQQKQQGAHGSPGHVHGGPIPPGRWRVHRPGSAHPDGGRMRPNWIPIGPVSGGRTHIYIHCGTLTEGCINVSQRATYNQIVAAVTADGGGYITVLGGAMV